jgi:hypothetical protein
MSNSDGSGSDHDSDDTVDSQWGSGRVEPSSDGETLCLLSDSYSAVDEAELAEPPQQGKTKRRKLRWTIRLWSLLQVAVFITVIAFLITSFSWIQARSPIIVSPYQFPEDGNSTSITTVAPCMYPRIPNAYRSTDYSCSVNGSRNVGFCPEKWTCAKTVNHNLVCLNTEFTSHCQEDYCFKFVSELPQSMHNGVLVRTLNVVLSAGDFGAALGILALAALIWLIATIGNQLWTASTDPLSEDMGWSLSHLNRKARSYYESSPNLQLFIDPKMRTLTMILVSEFLLHRPCQ